MSKPRAPQPQDPEEISKGLEDMVTAHGYKDARPYYKKPKTPHFRVFQHDDSGTKAVWVNGLRKPFVFLSKKDEFMHTGVGLDDTKRLLAKIHGRKL